MNFNFATNGSSNINPTIPWASSMTSFNSSTSSSCATFSSASTSTTSNTGSIFGSGGFSFAPASSHGSIFSQINNIPPASGFSFLNPASNQSGANQPSATTGAASTNVFAQQPVAQAKPVASAINPALAASITSETTPARTTTRAAQQATPPQQAVNLTGSPAPTDDELLLANEDKLAERAQRFSVPNKQKAQKATRQQQSKAPKPRKDGVTMMFEDQRLELTRAKAVVGTCMDMCPEQERYAREIQRDLSVFEMVPGTEGLNPKVDHSRAIKKYQRAAAGAENPSPDQIRPPEVLARTMQYMCDNVLDDTRYPFDQVYKFMRDRTRGIRQDFTFQNIRDQRAVVITEQIARFYILCHHRLCNYDRSQFDPQQNMEQLNKCLISLREFYADLAKDGILCPNEAEFQAYFMLSQLDNAEKSPVQSMLSIRSDVFHTPEMQFALQVMVALKSDNYRKFFQLVKQASYLAACLMHVHFLKMRTRGIMIMDKALKGQISLDDMVEILGFEDHDEAANFCEQFELIVDRQRNIVKFHDKARSLIVPAKEKIATKMNTRLIESKVQGKTNKDIVIGDAGKIMTFRANKTSAALPTTQIPQPQRPAALPVASIRPILPEPIPRINTTPVVTMPLPPPIQPKPQLQQAPAPVQTHPTASQSIFFTPPQQPQQAQPAFSFKPQQGSLPPAQPEIKFFGDLVGQKPKPGPVAPPSLQMDTSAKTPTVDEAKLKEEDREEQEHKKPVVVPAVDPQKIRPPVTAIQKPPTPKITAPKPPTPKAPEPLPSPIRPPPPLPGTLQRQQRAKEGQERRMRQEAEERARQEEIKRKQELKQKRRQEEAKLIHSFQMRMVASMFEKWRTMAYEERKKREHKQDKIKKIRSSAEARKKKVTVTPEDANTEILTEQMSFMKMVEQKSELKKNIKQFYSTIDLPPILYLSLLHNFYSSKNLFWKLVIFANNEDTSSRSRLLEGVPVGGFAAWFCSKFRTTRDASNAGVEELSRFAFSARNLDSEVEQQIVSMLCHPTAANYLQSYLQSKLFVCVKRIDVNTMRESNTSNELKGTSCCVFVLNPAPRDFSKVEAFITQECVRLQRCLEGFYFTKPRVPLMIVYPNNHLPQFQFKLQSEVVNTIQRFSWDSNPISEVGFVGFDFDDTITAVATAKTQAKSKAQATITNKELQERINQENDKLRRSIAWLATKMPAPYPIIHNYALKDVVDECVDLHFSKQLPSSSKPHPSIPVPFFETDVNGAVSDDHIEERRKKAVIAPLLSMNMNDYITHFNYVVSRVRRTLQSDLEHLNEKLSWSVPEFSQQDFDGYSHDLGSLPLDWNSPSETRKVLDALDRLALPAFADNRVNIPAELDPSTPVPLIVSAPIDPNRLCEQIFNACVAYTEKLRSLDSGSTGAPATSLADVVPLVSQIKQLLIAYFQGRGEFILWHRIFEEIMDYHVTSILGDTISGKSAIDFYSTKSFKEIIASITNHSSMDKQEKEAGDNCPLPPLIRLPPRLQLLISVPPLAWQPPSITVEVVGANLPQQQLITTTTTTTLNRIPIASPAIVAPSTPPPSTTTPTANGPSLPTPMTSVFSPERDSTGIVRTLFIPQPQEYQQQQQPPQPEGQLSPMVIKKRKDEKESPQFVSPKKRATTKKATPPQRPPPSPPPLLPAEVDFMHKLQSMKQENDRLNEIIASLTGSTALNASAATATRLAVAATAASPAPQSTQEEGELEDDVEADMDHYHQFSDGEEEEEFEAADTYVLGSVSDDEDQEVTTAEAAAPRYKSSLLSPASPSSYHSAAATTTRARTTPLSTSRGLSLMMNNIYHHDKDLEHEQVQSVDDQFAQFLRSVQESKNTFKQLNEYLLDNIASSSSSEGATTTTTTTTTNRHDFLNITNNISMEMDMSD